jgi:hypothetical protein
MKQNYNNRALEIKIERVEIKHEKLRSLMS